MASRIGRPGVFPQIAYDYIVIYWGKDIKYAPFLIFFSSSSVGQRPS